MNENNMLVNIDLEMIYPNPDNPRRDLGDLTELVDSIKENGILQNLTVVPWPEAEGGGDGKYLAVIGHRRCAAAKLAGLKTVPCMVTDMDRKTQLSTMMLENLQRNDLTVYEQARGFQLMIDLGDSVQTVAKRTGFSETLVRGRLKLAELDDKGLKEASERGATLFDFMKLNDIKDMDRRNEVLKYIGTNNYEYKLNNAKNEEKKESFRDWLVGELDQFAVKVTKQPENTDYIKYIGYYSYKDLDELKDSFSQPVDSADRQYYYKVDGLSSITLYADTVQREKTEEEIRREKETEDRFKRIEAIKERFEEIETVRNNFVAGVSNAKAKKHIDAILRVFVEQLTDHHYVNVDYDDLCALLKVDELPLEDQPAFCAFATAYSILNSWNMHTWNWNGAYSASETLNAVYDFLGEFGYVMGDEEKAIVDGTHELYLVVEPKPVQESESQDAEDEEYDEEMYYAQADYDDQEVPFEVEELYSADEFSEAA